MEIVVKVEDDNLVKILGDGLLFGINEIFVMLDKIYRRRGIF